MIDYILKCISEIKAISQNGLTYSKNEFDIERYNQLSTLAEDMTAYFSNNKIKIVKEYFSLEKGYATPKLDVRGLIIEDQKLLLVKERSDNLWALPGGWVDINESPSESVIREVFEETGFHVKAIKLLALWDKLKHEHPPQWPHTYKIFFLCEIISGSMNINCEISEIDFFPINKLPDLSTHRVTKNQISRLYELALKSENTAFD